MLAWVLLVIKNKFCFISKLTVWWFTTYYIFLNPFFILFTVCIICLFSFYMINSWWRFKKCLTGRIWPLNGTTRLSQDHTMCGCPILEGGRIGLYLLLTALLNTLLLFTLLIINKCIMFCSLLWWFSFVSFSPFFLFFFLKRNTSFLLLEINCM